MRGYAQSEHPWSSDPIFLTGALLAIAIHFGRAPTVCRLIDVNSENMRRYLTTIIFCATNEVEKIIEVSKNDSSENLYP